MSASPSMFAVVHRQIVEADETGYKRIVHVRVTTDAICGSMAAVPVTPERARAIGKLVALPDVGALAYTVAADPQWYERALELLIHPEDWIALLREIPMGATPLQLGDPKTVYGIPVSEQ